MPIVLNLSSKFRERLGDDVTNEFVDMLNTIDSTYVAELRQLNENNFARFDAKLEQRVAELRAEFRTAIADLRADMDAGLADLRAHTDGANTSLRNDLTALVHREAERLLVWMIGLFAAGIVTLVAALRMAG